MGDPLPGHTPVLPTEVVDLLAPRSGETIVDVTIGAGGHASRLAALVGPTGVLYGLDVDGVALETAARRLEGCGCAVALHRRSFTETGAILDDLGIAGFNVILADLGVSSMQLGDSQRGFSFGADGPLDMRMDDRQERTAADLVNRLSETELADLIYHNAQERFSRRIARHICRARRQGRITRTGQLAEIVCRALGADPRSRRSKVHPATRTFQALRIGVNDELESLKRFLGEAPRLLSPGGRVGIISFHSLEDGMVKRSFRRFKERGLYTLATKRPVVAGAEERRTNPRSRSAKLRVAQRTDRAWSG